MKLSIRAKLLGALGVDLLLVFVLGGFALQQMSVMSSKAGIVDDHTIPSIVNAERIHQVLTSFRRQQLEYLINTSDADRARPPARPRASSSPP